MIFTAVVEVVQNPTVQFFELLLFGLGLTAVAFIAIILWLDHQPEAPPITLVFKK
jgi:hypothetical protein